MFAHDAENILYKYLSTKNFKNWIKFEFIRFFSYT